MATREGLAKSLGGGQKRVPVPYLAVLWYTSAAVAVTSSRAVLRATHLPFCLSACQFLISTGLTYVLLRWALPWRTRGSYRVNLRGLPRESPERSIVQSIALTYTLGFLFTNVALSLCNASFAETVKAAEPISSLALAQLSRGEDAVSRIEWLTTLPIVAGVGLSSYSDTSFHVLGFLAAGTSNFMFSLRALHAKKLRRNHGSPVGLDDLHLFFRISSFGSQLLVPVALLFEGRGLLRLLFTSSAELSSAAVLGTTSSANDWERRCEAGGVWAGRGGKELENILCWNCDSTTMLQDTFSRSLHTLPLLPSHTHTHLPSSSQMRPRDPL